MDGKKPIREVAVESSPKKVPRRFCRFGRGRGCNCCGVDLAELGLVSATSVNRKWHQDASRTEPFLSHCCTSWSGMPYVDVHCHLEDVVQEIRRRQAVPSLNKEPGDLTDKELALWTELGWMEVETTEAAAPGRHWTQTWGQLSVSQRNAASSLGYTETSWNRNKWLLPRLSWEELETNTRSLLVALGETQRSWDGWSPQSWKTQSVDSGEARHLARMRALSEDRPWTELTPSQRKAAAALGFTKEIWMFEDTADLHTVVDVHFGAGFEGCITQGCDVESLPMAKYLALSHPMVFVTFGCHPKAAWFYTDEFEATLLSYIKACGEKVVGFGEFGLDFSHPYFGPDEDNRQQQREVFVRQLELAVSLSMPLVIHSREADADTLKLMRGRVPKAHKVHVHAHRGSISFMKQLLAEWSQLYIGMPGILTMEDAHAKELVRQCPLERMVVETDAPYLPVQGHWLSHPGLIPEVIAKVAELKGMDLRHVAMTLRANATALYGI
ncbi:TATDN2 [Symbiodinium necroappetens]|uniref:TATDN2 protein n=1 Tax=Symbiodinium necroappetens TaxID=1628268 RepID=A0A812L0E7_9DINO|nr:TATDN2 [Symbiodinium necroappetens]CAE7288454.1 TATDN2 [Symbiodinium sp. KB8]CAE7900469.1 TATDN2 [Symbiodinium microadriaticum]